MSNNESDLSPSNYSAYVWPAAPVLAQYIFHNRLCWDGKTVLELGAGMSLPAITAAKLGANVILTDLPDRLDNCRLSLSHNSIVPLDVLPFVWGSAAESIPHHVDFIIASDCFYDSKDYPDIVYSIDSLLRKNKGSEAIISYQERNSNQSIEALLLRYNLKAEYVPLADFGAASSDFTQCGSADSVHIFKLFPFTPF